MFEPIAAVDCLSSHTRDHCGAEEQTGAVMEVHYLIDFLTPI